MGFGKGVFIGCLRCIHLWALLVTGPIIHKRYNLVKYLCLYAIMAWRNERNTKLNNRIVNDSFITPDEAAGLKGVSRAAIYAAISERRLHAVKVLKRLALRKSEVLAWAPMPHSGRRKGFTVTEATRRRMSEAQKRRFAKLE